jgi:8-oxo-dGTP diphosphatase
MIDHNTKGSTMTSYCAGFLFNQDKPHRHVALILKNHPEWQRGKLNAIGGKIEEGETSAEAMRREFLEEAGMDVPDWQHTVLLCGADWNVSFFRAFGDLTQIKTNEEEIVGIYDVIDLPKIVIPNLRWLVPLQLDLGLTLPIVISYQH